jgi:hypothetical protein
MELEMATPTNYTQYDFTSLETAKSVMDVLAQVMVTSDVRQHGAHVLQPPADSPPQDSFFGVQLRETSVFAAIYTFNGTEADLAALISAVQSCRALGTTSGCTSCRWDLCEVFNSTTPSSVLHQLDLAPIATSLFNDQPSPVRGCMVDQWVAF